VHIVILCILHLLPLNLKEMNMNETIYTVANSISEKCFEICIILLMLVIILILVSVLIFGWCCALGILPNDIRGNRVVTLTLTG
jgi:fumarate reductase subunit D